MEHPIPTIYFIDYARFRPRHRAWWQLAGLLVLVLLTGARARAQAPAWQTLDAAGGPTAYVNAMATDAAGNVYLAGRYLNTATFGVFTLTSRGDADAFVAKWNPTFNGFEWAQSAGGVAYDEALALAVSGTSVYLTGNFNSATAAFGSRSLTNVDASGASGDVFVAKLTDTGGVGSFVWAQQAGGPGYDMPQALAVSGTSVYVSGLFMGATATFGTTIFSNTGRYADAFVTKLTDAGASASFGWTYHIEGPSSEYTRGLAASGGNVYVAGWFDGSTATLGATTLTNAASGNADILVAKLTDGGTSPTLRWAIRAGGARSDFPTAAVLQGNALFLAGIMSSATMAFGATTLTNARANYADVFVAKLLDTGSSSNFAWAQQAGGPNDEGAKSLAVSGTHVYVAGDYDSPAMVFGSTTVGGQGGPDVFVTRLTDGGTSAVFDWVQVAGGRGTDLAPALATVGARVYVAGQAITPATFGSLPYVFPATSRVAYLASLTDNLVTATTIAAPLAGLSLAPNPAHATTTVHLPPVPAASEATLTLFDGLGRLVHTRRLALPATGATAELPLAGLTPGLYQLLVQAGVQRTSRPLTVE